jgi:hypothetical protein
LASAAILLCWICVRCCATYHPNWPEAPAQTRVNDSGAVERSYTSKSGSAAKYTQRLENGRVTALLFDDDGDGKVDETVSLTGDHPDWPHFLIILDGVPFDVVQAMYQEGHFRLFPPPARVASVFPAMTDVALSCMFHTKPCSASEALFFDRRKNRLSDGNTVYLRGENAPWIPHVDYAAPQRVAIGTYLNPSSVFAEEMTSIDDLLSKSLGPQAAAYSIGTAGLGTRGGEPAIRVYLADVEKLCERITHDRRGRVRFSITADHGQTLRRCDLVSFDKVLSEAGLRKTSSIKTPDDVVVVAYGLITCVMMYTDRPAAVATALVGHPAVDLVTYRSGDSVIVRNAEQSAAIRKQGAGYVYDASRGDPLHLSPIIEQLRAQGAVDAEGVISDRPLMQATAAHQYPDPLSRLWSCFDGLVTKQADVIASLKPEACHGSKLFHVVVAPVASTHGGLDYLGSVTFLLDNSRSTPLPEILRVDDVLETIGWVVKKTASTDSETSPKH